MGNQESGRVVGDAGGFTVLVLDAAIRRRASRPAEFSLARMGDDPEWLRSCRRGGAGSPGAGRLRGWNDDGWCAGSSARGVDCRLANPVAVADAFVAVR